MEWTTPIMIVLYVFIALFFYAMYDVCDTLHDIRSTLERISTEIRRRPSWEQDE